MIGKGLNIVVKQLRLYQWVKNVLLFVPLLLAHKVNDADGLLIVLLGFFSFGLVASAIYIVNDIVDIEHDKAHPVKRNRPIPAGDIPVSLALSAVPILLLIAYSISFFYTNSEFTVWLTVYAVTSLLYSFVLKRLALADVLVLSGLYVVRIEAGGALASVEVSQWLLAFSLFLFTSLAFLKRYSELCETVVADGGEIAGRGYIVGDEVFVGIAGPSVGFLSVLVLTLYVNSHEIQLLYTKPSMLWLLVPILLYWISRMWLLVNRGGVKQDPILFTVTDPPSYVVGLLAAIIVIMAAL